MKFQLKALVAALAIVAAVPAQAALNLAGTGDSSLILTLVDGGTGSANVSATFDLGYTFSTFDRTVNQSWDLVSNLNYSAAWTAFNAAATSGKQWGVYAADSLGNGAGQQQRFATANTSAGLGVMQNINLAQSAPLFDQFITQSNNAVDNGSTVLNNHNQVDDGSNFINLGALNAAFAGSVNAYGTDGRVAASGADTNGAFDSNLFVWTLTRSSSTNFTTATNSQVNVAGFNPFFTLSSNGVLTYTASNAAPIPEPETYGMLLAGLGMIGFVARRRKSA